MSVDKIIDRILEDAKADAAATMDAARQKAAAAAQAIAQEADRAVSAIEAQAQADCAEEHRRGRLIAELQGRKDALAQRREVLDEAFSQALKDLHEQKGPKWEALITSVVLQGARTGREKLRVPAGERELYLSGGLLERLNGALARKGLPGNLSLDDGEVKSGVALIGETSDVDDSLEALLADVRQRCEHEIDRLLYEKAEAD